jgi:hypothetical protein
LTEGRSADRIGGPQAALVPGEHPPGTGPGEVHPGDREFEELLEVQDHLQEELERVRSVLEGTDLRELMRVLRARRGTDGSEAMSEVLHHVEQALRALKVSDSELRREQGTAPVTLALDGLPDLPPFMARFLAERAEAPGFTWEVADDPIRGWIVRWKEFAAQGTVRGSGQIYERPYAWLDE